VTDPYQRRGRRARLRYTVRYTLTLLAILFILLLLLFGATGCGVTSDPVPGTNLILLENYDEHVTSNDVQRACADDSKPLSVLWLNTGHHAALVKCPPQAAPAR
jgi:hypothetical protein